MRFLHACFESGHPRVRGQTLSEVSFSELGDVYVPVNKYARCCNDPFLAHSLDSILILITHTDFSTDPIILVLLNPIFQPSKLFKKNLTIVIGIAVTFCSRWICLFKNLGYTASPCYC